MNNRFTVEETNLISIFKGESSDIRAKNRVTVIQDISAVIRHLDDEEMIMLSMGVLEKLNDMSDEEFAAMEFIKIQIICCMFVFLN